MEQLMTRGTLEVQNQIYAGTGGVSPENRTQGFLPGFLDKETGSVYLSRKADGSPAPIHLMDGLPENLILARSPSGQVAAVKKTVVAGFIRDGLFFTREQVACELK
jgi:hypothetical protein